MLTKLQKYSLEKRNGEKASCVEVMNRTLLGGFVSIVIPLFNSQDYIAETIESCLAQTYKNFDVICIDDGSTDTSYSVAQQYYPAIRLIQQTNSGVAAARNAGASASKGNYLLFLDADDWIDSDYLTQTVPLMGADPYGVGIVSTGMQRFGLRNDIVPAVGVTLEHEMFSNDIPITSLIRRDAFPGYKKMVSGGLEDWELWIHILKNGWSVATVDFPLFHYRVHEGSMRTTMDFVKGYSEIKHLHPELFNPP